MEGRHGGSLFRPPSGKLDSAFTVTAARDPPTGCTREWVTIGELRKQVILLTGRWMRAET